MASRKREYKVGDRVKMILGNNKDQQGTVRFVGETKFGKASGSWLGIELDTKTGKNDGSVQGVSYFKCEAGYGLFAKPSMVRPVAARKAADASKRSGAKSRGSSDAHGAKGRGSSDAHGAKGRGVRGKPRPSPKAAPSPKPKESDDEPSLSTADPPPKKAALARQPSSGLSAAAEAAAADADRKEARSRARQNKKDEFEVESLRAQLAAAKEELIGTKSKLKLVQQTVIILKQAEHKGGAAVKEIQEEMVELKDTLEELRLEKEIAEETAEDLQEELELLKEQLKTANLEIQLLKQRNERAADDAISALPENEQEGAKLAQQVHTLTDALRQLRDVSMAEKRRFETTDQQQKRQLEKLSADSEQLKATLKELEQAHSDVEELKEQLDEATGFQELVEDLSEKNVTLGEKVADFEREIAEYKELLQTADDLEEGYQENEEALTADLEAEQARTTQLTRELKVAEQKMQDYERAIANFRAAIAEMKDQQALVEQQRSEEAQLAEDGGQSKDAEQRSAATRMLKLHSRINEFRRNAVKSALSDIEGDKLRVQIDYLKTYIPDNLKIDQSSMLLLSSLRQMESKATVIQDLIDKFYGADVGAVVSESGLDPISVFAARVSNIILEIRSALLTLHTCLSEANETDYDTAAQRFQSLNPVSSALDAFIELIAQDRITDVTPVEPLVGALDQIRKFSASYFSKMTDDREPVPPRDTLPRVDEPVAILMSAERLACFQQLVTLGMEHLEVLVHGKQPPEDVLSVYNSLEQLHIKCKTMVKGAVKFAQAIQDKASHATEKLDQAFQKCDGMAQQLVEVVSESTRNLRTELVKTTSDNGATVLMDELQKMGNEERQESLGAYLHRFLRLLATLNTELESTMTGGGVKISLFRNEQQKPMWEVRASVVRAELTEAAQLKFRLEESNMTVEEKQSELYEAQKATRECQTKIEVLQQRLKLVEEQAGDAAELRAEVAKLHRQDVEYHATMESVQRSLEKVTRENTALKQKLAKLSISKVSHSRSHEKRGSSIGGGHGVGNGGGGGHTSLANMVVRGDAIDSIEMLAQTVRSLRHQLGTVTSMDTTKKLAMKLPPLPDVKRTRVHAVSHHTFGDNLASVAQRERLAPESGLGKRLTALSNEISTVSDKLWKERASPRLVDLTKMKVDHGSIITPGGEYVEQEHRRMKLRSDTNFLRKELEEFVSEENANSTQVPSKLPATAGAPAHLGRVVIPHGHMSYSSELILDRLQMSRLFSMFV